MSLLFTHVSANSILLILIRKQKLLVVNLTTVCSMENSKQNATSLFNSCLNIIKIVQLHLSRCCKSAFYEFVYFLVTCILKNISSDQ